MFSVRLSWHLSVY